MDGDVGTRSAFVEDDVRVTSVRLCGFLVNELVFPASHAHRLDPEEGYLGVVLEGAFEKTFVSGTRGFAPGTAFTMPAGATHETRFGRHEARVLILHPVGDPTGQVPWPRVLATFRQSRSASLGTAWRLSGELRAQDDAWPLAAEGLCLELVAGFIRGESQARDHNGSRAWLEPVRERLHAEPGARRTLAELAATAGVHPVHLCRSFRARYGTSVGEYVRRLRLDWAASQLSATETPVAVIAAEAGFADQSHFTRAFKRHTGLTPGRYRRAVQR